MCWVKPSNKLPVTILVLVMWPAVSQGTLATQDVLVASSPTNQTQNASNLSASDLKARLDNLIDQLGDPSYIKREAAKAEIESYGILAFEKLSAAELHPNVEIAHSASYLLQSMRVVWTLPTDSFDVQRMLKHYNEATVRNKTDVLQRLAKLGRTDGYLALLRLVRYERDERISKAAALALMEAAINERFHDLNPLQSGSPRATRPTQWAQMINNSIGDSTRAAAQWLITLASQLESTEADLSTWQKHVLQERLLLESNAKSNSSELKTEDQIVKQLYRLVAQLLVAKDQRQAALEFFQPCLELVAKDRASAINDVQWMLAAGLPEAVLSLDAQRPDLLKSRARNRYLLAESYFKLDRHAEANKIAREALELSVLAPGAINGLPATSIADNEARQRLDNYNYLVGRTLFDWAEAELLRVLNKSEGEPGVSIVQELTVRNELSRFYWGAGQPEKAAQMWQPILARAGMLSENSSTKPDQDLISEMKLRSNNDVSYFTLVPSRYHFYKGLAASDNQDWPTAREQLQKSLALDGTDPDLLIAMHRAIGDDQAYGQLVSEAIDRLETVYRNEIVQAEGEVAQASHRNLRQDHERLLAEHLNQLAWLLAGTERKTKEALAMSQRSLTLVPEYAIYMDTLARCYFADKQLQRAVEVQQKAVDLMPYERSMHRQLAEFQSALAQSN